MRAWLAAIRLIAGFATEMGAGVFTSWIAVSVAGSVAPLLFAIGLRPLVDGIDAGRTSDVVLGAIVCAAALLVLVAIPATRSWIITRVSERAILAMQRRMLHLSANAPGLEPFEKPDVRNRLQLLRRNLGDVVEAMATIFVTPLAVVQLVIATAMLARLQPWLLLLPLVAIPAAWLTKRAENIRRDGEERVAERRRAAEHLLTVASSPQAAKEVRIYGLRDELVGRHHAISVGIQRIRESALYRAEGLSGIGWLGFALAYLAAVLIALDAAAAGDLTPGDVAMVLALAAAVIAASGQLSNLAGLLARAVAVADHYQGVVDQLAVEAADHQPRAVVPTRIRSSFELRDVGFTYGDSQQPALDGIDLRLDAGGVIALVGENGAGKTTLVKLLSRMYTPTRGQILLDGVDLQEFDPDAYRRRLAAGFQDFARFELLARESVGVGDLARIEDVAVVRTALAKTNAGFAENLPAGLETQLGRAWEGGVELSGGEWQKLALARAMMRDSSGPHESADAHQPPLLVIFDEPTASLDPQTEHALFEQIAADSRRAAETGRVTLLISTGSPPSAWPTSSSSSTTDASSNREAMPSSWRAADSMLSSSRSRRIRTGSSGGAAIMMATAAGTVPLRERAGRGQPRATRPGHCAQLRVGDASG